jgi:hypothetical protein
VPQLGCRELRGEVVKDLLLSLRDGPQGANCEDAEKGYL